MSEEEARPDEIEQAMIALAGDTAAPARGLYRATCGCVHIFVKDAMRPAYCSWHRRWRTWSACPPS